MSQNGTARNSFPGICNTCGHCICERKVKKKSIIPSGYIFRSQRRISVRWGSRSCQNGTYAFIFWAFGCSFISPILFPSETRESEVIIQNAIMELRIRWLCYASRYISSIPPMQCESTWRDTSLQTAQVIQPDLNLM